MKKVFDWQGLLTQWNGTIFDSKKLDELVVSEHQWKTKWLGYPGATEKQLAQVERRLGRPLPPSYRQFLQFTNGWHWPEGRLRTTEELRHRLREMKFYIMALGWSIGTILGSLWMGEGYNWGIPDEEKFVYGEEQDDHSMRLRYQLSLLQISGIDDFTDSVYVLNPKVINTEEEWEAWFFADWLPGAVHYQSFWELMEAEYEEFLAIEREES